jgi:hypothetical protein
VSTIPRLHPAPEASLDVRRRSRPGPGRRLLRGVVLLTLVLGLAGLLLNVVLVRRLERIEDAFAGLTDRPPAAPGSTFLMVGTEPGGTGGPDIPWLTGTQSVEAVMVIDVAPDRLSARVETLPVRSGTAVTASSTRPSDTVAAVEAWTGERVDHLVAIDWATFVRLAEHNGVDPAYTYGSAPTDQHDFLRRVMDGALHQEMRKRPLDLYRALSTTVDGTAVDDNWSLLEMDLLLLQLRDLRSAGITYEMARPARP